MFTNVLLRVMLALVALCALPSCATVRLLDDDSPFRPALQASAASCTADEGTREEHWKAFRARFPYHAQTIAVSKTFGGGCRTLVVAEPPPQATLDGLQKASGVEGLSFVASHHRVGHDGWVADAVAVLPPLEDQDLSSVVSQLSRYLFKTSYKAYATKISGAASKGDVKLDVKVTPAEIEQWIFDPAARFSPVAGGAARTLEETGAEGESGVYFVSSQPIVAWSIPRGADLASLAVEARQFALDSDVLFGAVATRSAILVLGRERAVSVDVLPPLRFETLTLLASSRENQLAQSYERNHVLAGRFAPGKDWAPIYLSPALVDTEYGSLLDVTDQILKSWSNLGQTTYDNFDYPAPKTWPFEMAAPDQIKSHNLIYNWNTRGLGAVFDAGDHQIFAVRGTASHSVMYAPEDGHAADAHALEARAYTWFSGLEDPNLARTVQYTIFYQIARNLGLHSRYAVRADVSRAGVETLQQSVYELLKRLRDATGESVKAAMERSASYWPDLNENQRRAFMLRALLHIEQYKARLARADDDTLRLMAKMLASPLELQQGLAAMTNVKLPAAVVDELTRLIQFTQEISKHPMLLQGVVDAAHVKDAYIAASARRRSTWIHTPAVVVSSNRGALAHGIGGHNIDAKVSRFQIGEHPTPSGPPALRPEDLRRVVFSTEGGPTLGAAPVEPRRPVAALHVEPREAGKVSRGFSPNERGQVQAGWAVGDAASSGGCGANCIRMRLEDNVIHIEADGMRPISTNNYDGAAEALQHVARTAPPGEGPLQIDLVGFSRREARAAIRTARTKVRFEATYHAKAGDVVKELEKPFDLSQATVQPAERVVSPDGKSSEVGVEITIPRGPENPQGGKVWVRGVFDKVVPDSVKALFEDAARKASSGSAKPKELRLRLRKELDVLRRDNGLLEMDFRDFAPFDWGSSRREPITREATAG